jgi:GAF domain-containing protein
MTISDVSNDEGVAAVAKSDRTEKTISRESRLARTLVELADTLVADFDVIELLTLLTSRCVEVLGIKAAGIMLLGPDGDLRVMASSSDTMRILELFEIQSSEGPCLDAFRNSRTAAVADLSLSNGGWPRFSAEASPQGFDRFRRSQCGFAVP